MWVRLVQHKFSCTSLHGGMYGACAAEGYLAHKDPPFP